MEWLNSVDPLRSMSGYNKLSTGSTINGAKVMLPEIRDTDKMPVARVAAATNMAVAAIANAKSPVAIIAIGAIMKPHTVTLLTAPNWIAAVLVRK